MHGARKGHEVYDCSWPLSLAIEQCSAHQLQIAGITMARKKFFDLLEHDIGHAILQHFGAPSGHLSAARNMYSRLKCCYKVNRAMSPFFARSNGFAQGDSYSVQIALAVVSLWTRYMKSDPYRDLHCYW